MNRYRVKPGARVQLRDRDARDTGDYRSHHEVVRTLEEMDPQAPERREVDWKKARRALAES
jgi:hypothetical protein